MPIQKTTPDEIIIASIQVFRQKGYYRTSMADLAAGAGMSKGVFYHHFKSKEDVMIQALGKLRRWFRKRVFSFAFEEEKSEAERMQKMFEAVYNAFVEQPGGCFFANTVLETINVEDTFLPEIQGFYQDWQNALTHLFRPFFPEAELEEKVEQCLTDIEGSILLMQLYRDNDYLKRALERTQNMI